MTLKSLIEQLQEVNDMYPNSEFEIRLNLKHQEPLLIKVDVTEYLDDERLCLLLTPEGL
tara:strand:- start:10169 stop:10345 length:177 start_codon:yes stop_codon:yes gene_type:complete